MIDAEHKNCELSVSGRQASVADPFRTAPRTQQKLTSLLVLLRPQRASSTQASSASCSHSNTQSTLMTINWIDYLNTGVD